MHRQEGEASLMPSVLQSKALVIIAIIIGSNAELARAEGGCPQGMYPIGGQGVTGCAPMRGTEGGAAAPRPVGRWLKTWGAIADSHNGLGAPITGAKSKAEASRRAVELCRSKGGIGCAVAFTYKNQCVAVVRVGAGQGNMYFGRATVEMAREAAGERCRQVGGTICQIILADCTEPLFIRY